MFRLHLLMGAALLVMTGAAARCQSDLPDPVRAAVRALAERSGINEDSITIIEYESVQWPDTSLGLPQPGRVYAQVITPGYRVVLDDGAGAHVYHTDMRGDVAYAGPLPGPRLGPWQGAPDVVSAAIHDLAERLGIGVEAVNIAWLEEVTWLDGAIGLPRPGMAYTKALVPGYEIMLHAEGTDYFYHATEDDFYYAGPASLWEWSLGYLEPDPADPNLNSTLMRVSLLGTHDERVAGEVGEFAADATGGLLAVRRTSRSSFSMSYLPARGAEPVEVTGASFLGHPALSPEGSRFAVAARERLGAGPQVWLGEISRSETAVEVKITERLSAPEGGPIVEIMWTPADEEPCVIVSDQGVLTAFVPSVDGPSLWEPSEECLQWRLKAPLGEGRAVWVTDSPEGEAPGLIVLAGGPEGEPTAVASLPPMEPVRVQATTDGRLALVVGRTGEGTYAAVVVDLVTGDVFDALPEAQSPAALIHRPVRVIRMSGD